MSRRGVSARVASGWTQVCRWFKVSTPIIMPSCAGKCNECLCLSYTYEDERGIFPEVQYVLDLELPASFEPVNSDGEVDSFMLVPCDQVLPLHVIAYHS